MLKCARGQIKLRPFCGRETRKRSLFPETFEASYLFEFEELWANKECFQRELLSSSTHSFKTWRSVLNSESYPSDVRSLSAHGRARPLRKTPRQNISPDVSVLDRHFRVARDTLHTDTHSRRWRLSTPAPRRRRRPRARRASRPSSRRPIPRRSSARRRRRRSRDRDPSSTTTTTPSATARKGKSPSFPLGARVAARPTRARWATASARHDGPQI